MVAVVAGRGDVGMAVQAAIALRLQMLGGTATLCCLGRS